MRKTKLIFYPLIASLPLVLTSCSVYDIFGIDVQSASNGVNHDSDWTTDVLPFSIKETQETLNADALPPTGNVNVLVLPIEFTDQPFSSSFMSDLNHAFNGNGKEDTGYWESVSSFYEKSSYGKSHLNFEIAPTYKTGLTQIKAYDKYVTKIQSGFDVSYSSDNGVGLIKLAYESYLSQVGSSKLKEFDSDSNGYIDGVIAVYSGLDCSNSPVSSYDGDSNYYWAYTYYTTMTSASGNWCEPNKNSPTPNAYIWLSYDFFYNAVSSPSVDTHTIIHEMGHMYGLDDYYPSSSNPIYSKQNLAGGWDMMDENILDHDVYSKMILGWTSPHVVTEPGTYSINPACSSGDCLLIPSSSWNGTAYDEYMLLELYTPTDLNYLDSHTKYPGRLLGYSTYGVKLYHIDSRLLELKQNTKTGYISYSIMDDPKSGLKYSYDSSTAYGYMIGPSNCNKNSAINSACALIHMMEADGVFHFKNGGLGNNSDLFETGDYFSLSLFSSFFSFADSSKKTCFNSGKEFPYSITFSEVTSNHATVTVNEVS